MSYTKYLRGSEWRKWDLHIHTPETKKNDQFEGSTTAEKWQNYIDTINSSSEDISVLGITDYFSIENYFKFKSYVVSGAITKKFELIIPNIELRVLPVTGQATAVNLHCLFNPSIDIELEGRFFAKLRFANSGTHYGGTRSELIRFGRDHNSTLTLDDDTAYRKGIEQYVVTVDSLRDIFKNDPILRENTIIVVSNSSNDGASGITKHEDFFVNKSESQLDATRRSLYQFSDAIFSSNESDRKYFTGQSVDSEDVVIFKCGTLKPCFHGCDAHSNDKVFKPAENRFCWIKADPTFEGLKQALYEPEDRVRIQALKPDVKNERQVISEIEFIDQGNLFGNQKLYLNENLNSIIGGKSSGKSLLLHSVANSIDPEQVEKTAKRLAFDGYKFTDPFDFKVTWKNGDVDLLSEMDRNAKLHKITYIPQLYINYLVEKNNKDELNSLIKSILLQDEEFKVFFEYSQLAIDESSSEIDRLVNDFLRIKSQGNDASKRSKEIGKSDTIGKSIEKIESDILAAQQSSSLTPDEFAEYNRLIAEKSVIEQELRDIVLQEGVAQRVLLETRNSRANLLGRLDTATNITYKGQVDRILDELGTVPAELVAMKAKIAADFDALIQNLENEIRNLGFPAKKISADAKLLLNTSKLAVFAPKIAGQQELQKLTGQLQSEKIKLQSAQAIELQLNNLRLEFISIRTQIASLLRQRISLYETIAHKINETKKSIGSGVELNATLIYKLDDFLLYQQANKVSIGSDHYLNSLHTDGLLHFNMLPAFFDHGLTQNEATLKYGESGTIPLKSKIEFEEVLRGLVKDAFTIDYSVTYKGDNLLNMSPGKKGTVLLILFLQISSAEHPILIDQPEDNLDNRTIYDLLCSIIKVKKKDRQICIVSHNANLVVATDSENIIVANQQGQDGKENEGDNKFEYISGSLEHSFSKGSAPASVLNSQGIREHVCDILEGGDKAFKQRERKYSIKS